MNSPPFQDIHFTTLNLILTISVNFKCLNHLKSLEIFHCLQPEAEPFDLDISIHGLCLLAR